MYDPKETRKSLEEDIRSIPFKDFNSQYDKVSRQVQRNHGETDAQRRMVDARIYAKGQTEKNDIPLVDMRQERKRFTDNGIYANVIYTPRAVQKEEKMKISKSKAAKIVAGIALVATIAVVPNVILATIQHDGMTEANSIAAIEKVPFNDTYELVVKGDGSAYYQNAEGEKLDVIQGISADELAQNMGYEVPEKAQKSGRLI